MGFARRDVEPPVSVNVRQHEAEWIVRRMTTARTEDAIDRLIAEARAWVRRYDPGSDGR